MLQMAGWAQGLRSTGAQEHMGGEVSVRITVLKKLTFKYLQSLIFRKHYMEQNLVLLEWVVNFDLINEKEWELYE